MKTIPWNASKSISPFLDYEVFPDPIGCMVLKRDKEIDTLWLIHSTEKAYCITKVGSGGDISRMDTHDNHPLQIEGRYNHPLKFKIHMDAYATSPIKRSVINLLKSLCDRSKKLNIEPSGLMIGDVIFTGNSHFIRTVTKSNWSHASLYIGGNQVAETTKSKGKTIGERLDKRSDIYRTPAEPILKNKTLSVLRHPDWELLSEDKFSMYSALGYSKKYSLVSAARSFLSKCGLVKVKSNGVFCSQYVLDVYYKLGLSELEHKTVDPYTVTPRDLYELLLNIGFETVPLDSIHKK